MACYSFPRWLVDLLTYYSLTCWLVDSLTLNKIGVNWILMDLIGVKIPNSPEVVGGWGMWQLPKLWWGFGSCGVVTLFNSFYTIGKL